MKKNLMRWLIVLVILLLCMVVAVAADNSSVSVWNGSATATAFENGNGTSSNPFQIKTASQLKYLATLLRSESGNNASTYGTAYYKLTSNLDMGRYAFEGIRYFSGTFDGNGHSIVGLNIRGEDGLFSTCTNATIKNLTVDGLIRGVQPVGGIVGHIYGGRIENCVNYCGVIRESDDGVNLQAAGGIVGSAAGKVTITGCRNYGELCEETGRSSAIGGIVGRTYDVHTYTESSPCVTISYCANMADISGAGTIGGIVGELHGGKVEYCANAGNISGSSRVGGIVGEINSYGYQGDSDYPAEYAAARIVRNSYNTGKISASNEKAGGVVGYGYSADLKNLYSIGKISTSKPSAAGEISYSGGNSGGLYYLAGINSGLANSVSAVALTDASMRQQANFSGYSFSSSGWGWDSTGSYPYPVIAKLGAVERSSACNHVFANPVWDWSSFYTNATLYFTCQKDPDHMRQYTVTPTKSNEAATCTEAAKTVYLATKTVDGVYYSDRQEQSSGQPKGHSYGEYVSDENATCLADGTKTALCRNGCGTKSTVTDVGSKLDDHTPGAVVKENLIAATCERDGICDEVVYCVHCSVELERNEVVLAALGHTSVVDAAVAPTCTEDGVTEGSHCDVCGKVLIMQEVVPSTGHGYQLDEAVEPTCAKTGLTLGASCPNCDYVHLQQEIVPILPHTAVVVPGKAATCTAAGLTEGSYCSVCEQTLTEQQEIPLADHTPEAIPAVAATCTATGLTEGSKCNVCGEVLVAQQETPMIDHAVEVIPAVAPTCTATGLTEGSRCVVCGEILVAQTITQKISHSVVIDYPQAATCTEAGYSGNGMHCGVCGEVLLARTEVPALGHNTVQHEAQAPTAESIGWEAYETCTRCSYTTYVELPKLEVTKYAITVPAVSNGTVTVDKTEAEAGETVTITATPAEGYELDAIYVDGVAIEGNTFVITGDHTVTAIFTMEEIIIASGYCGGEGDGTNLTWTLYEDGELVISGSGAMENWSYDSNPWYSYRDDIEKVAIDDGVTTIGDLAFYQCSGLSDVDIQDGVITIGDRAFYQCSNLSYVYIPDSVTTLGDLAFCQCYSLSDLVIRNGVTTIGNDAFVGCYSLSKIMVTDVNEFYSDVEGVLFNKDKTRLIRYPAAKPGEVYTIPDSVTAIEDSAFQGCKSLIWFMVADGNEFYSTVDGVLFNKDKTTIVQYPALMQREAYTIPDSVTTIGDYAFADCYRLNSVDIPDSVTTIGDGAFSDCCSLSDADIPDSVTTIGEYAFYNSWLSSVDIPDSVTTIGEYAFSNCTVLSCVEFMGDAPSSMGSGVFSDTSFDLTIYYHEGTAGWPTTGTWQGCPLVMIPAPKETFAITVGESANGTIAVDKTEAEVGETVTITATPAEGYELDAIYVDGVAIEGNSFTITGSHTVTAAFIKVGAAITASGYCGREGDGTDLTWVLYDNGELVISGEGAMMNWSSATYVPWYSDCDNIKTVIVGESVTNIGSYAFFSCDHLSSVNIPDSVTDIGRSAFYWCHNLSSVIIGDGVTNIGAHAFYGCTGLSSVTIGNSVRSIGAYAFRGCNSLSSVEIPDNVNAIGEDSFSHCVSLSHVTIGDGLTDISSYSFRDCDSLSSVTVGNSVTRIGSFAFESCDKLSRVELKGNAPASMGISVFENCAGGLTFYYHEGTVGWPTTGTWQDRPLVMIPAPKETFAITVGESANGTIAVDKTEAEAGETVTITATPAEGYRLMGIKVDGTAITGNTFAVTGNHEVTAEFATLLNFASTSANVGDVLDLNFRVTAAEVDFEGGYAILSGPQGEQRVDRADWQKSGTRYNIPYKGMFATMMADEVTAVVYDDNGNQMVAAQSDSIRGYTMRALNTYGSEPKYAKLCVLLVDMLVYGATAQEKFGHNAADPADSLLSDAQRALATVEAKPYQSIQEKSHDGNSASATLGSRIELNFTFLKSDVEGAASAKFTFDHAQSTLGAAEVIVPASEFAESGSTKWKIALNALVAADGRQPVRCEILDADGNVLAWSVDTVAGYVARLVGGNANYKWVESMVIFCDSAYGYFCG